MFTKNCLGVMMAFAMLSACQNTRDTSLHEVTDGDNKTYITNDTISVVRKNVKEESVATYTTKVTDDLNQWKFSVQLFETSNTFDYIMKVQYKELRVTDTLHIPNFGIMPAVELKPGKKEFDCIVGFKDKKDEFKEYKRVYVDGDQLKITKLKSYFVGVYSTKQP